MGVNSLPKTVTRQRRGCDLNPGPTALESSTLTTRLPTLQLDMGRNYVTVTLYIMMDTRVNSGSQAVTHDPLTHIKTDP